MSLEPTVAVAAGTTGASMARDAAPSRITFDYRDITHLIGSAKRGQKFLNVYDDCHTVNGPDGSPRPERVGELWSDRNGTWWSNCWLGDTHPVRMYRCQDDATTAFQRHVRRYHKRGQA